MNAQGVAPRPTSRPAPLEVDRVVENHPDGTHSHLVTVTLSPAEHRQLVGDIARRVFSLVSAGHPVLHRIVAAGRTTVGHVDDLERQDELTRLVNLLAMPRPAVTLDAAADEVGELIAALEEAAAEPATCSCGNAVDVWRSTECGTCLDGQVRAGAIGGRP